MFRKQKFYTPDQTGTLKQCDLKFLVMHNTFTTFFANLKHFWNHNPYESIYDITYTKLY